MLRGRFFIGRSSPFDCSSINSSSTEQRRTSSKIFVEDIFHLYFSFSPRRRRDRRATTTSVDGHWPSEGQLLRFLFSVFFSFYSKSFKELINKNYSTREEKLSPLHRHTGNEASITSWLFCFARSKYTVIIRQTKKKKKKKKKNNKKML